MFVALLAALFIGLKLAGVIAWSWLWVLSPIWIAAALWFLVVFSCIALALYTGQKIVLSRKR